MRTAAAALAGLLLIAALSEQAVGEPRRSRTTANLVVVAEGSATIYRNDTVGAQDRAIQAAMLRALENHQGIYLEARTLIADDELVQRDLQIRTRGFVHGYDILAVSREGNVAHVRLRVELGERPAPEMLRRLQDGRSLVLVNATGRGAAGALDTLRQALARPFPGSKVILPTRTFGADLLLSAGSGQALDPASVRAISGRARVNTLIMASVHTEQLSTAGDDIGYSVPSALTFHVASSSGSIIVLSGTDGEVLAMRSFVDHRAADPADADIAARHSIASLAASMRAFVAEYLIEHLQERERSLRIVIRGAGVPDGRLRRRIAESRWTEELEMLEFGIERAVFVVRSRVPVALYVDELRGDPAIQVVSFDAATAEVQLRLAR